MQSKKEVISKESRNIEWVMLGIAFFSLCLTDIHGYPDLSTNKVLHGVPGGDVWPILEGSGHSVGIVAVIYMGGTGMNLIGLMDGSFSKESKIAFASGVSLFFEVAGEYFNTVLDPKDVFFIIVTGTLLYAIESFLQRSAGDLNNLSSSEE